MDHLQPATSQSPSVHIPYGTHICHLYEKDSEFFEVTVPYLSEALDHEELCLIICSKERRSVLSASFSTEKPMLRERLGHGRVEFLEATPGMSSISDIWDEAFSKAAKYGCRGIRVSCVSDCANLSIFDSQEFTFFPSPDIRASILCSYCTANMQLSEIVQVVQKHHCTLVKQHGAWQLIEQPNHIDDPLSSLDELGQMAIAMDKEGRILGATNAYRGFFDCGNSKTLGESLKYLGHQFCVQSIAETIPPVATSDLSHLPGQLYDYWNVRLPSQGKRTLFVSLQETDWHSYTGKVWVLTFWDITAFWKPKDLTEDLTPIIMHEMKNPLQTLKAVNDLLKVSIETDRADLHRLISMSDSSIDQIATLTEDLLALKKRKGCKLSISSAALDLTSLLKELLGPYSTASKHQIIPLFDDATPLYVSGEPCRIRQVVTNLLDNAIKFTPLCKRIWVNLKTSEDYATVIVEDEGIGVPIDERDYIFDPFYRSSNAPQEETGVGLGLYISKRLAGLLGGDLVAVERPQGGTIVEFSLPLEPGRNTASTR